MLHLLQRVHVPDVVTARELADASLKVLDQKLMVHAFVCPLEGHHRALGAVRFRKIVKRVSGRIVQDAHGNALGVAVLDSCDRRLAHRPATGAKLLTGVFVFFAPT
ncbi:MAG: hypothetical protein F4Z72_05155 [Gemmatimonadales bacterium]|nr:hypothetical protein [Candidatus Palauibacter irciniicola]MYC17085.1 hypothetical protein [Gemmatimonadales bacterium]